MSLKTTMQNLMLDVVARLPQNALSRVVGRATRVRSPRPVAKFAVKTFAQVMNINVDEAERPLDEYPSVHDFFVRRLRRGARKVDPRGDVFTSPCDGVVGEFGAVSDGRCLQAKGRSYSVQEFLQDDEWSQIYRDGTFLTIYLSPRHYHRVHSPLAGEVVRADHIPGALLPVNMPSINKFDGVFVKNERLTAWIDTEQFGRVALVMVGATCVGEMSAAFDSQLVTNRGGALRQKLYDPAPVLNKGSELGTFHMGSTVVVLLEGQGWDLSQLKIGADVVMGEALITAKAASEDGRGAAQAPARDGKRSGDGKAPRSKGAREKRSGAAKKR